MDCEAASEGKRYYMEQYNITEDAYTMLYSCFKQDGLCLKLPNYNLLAGVTYYIMALRRIGNNST